MAGGDHDPGQLPVGAPQLDRPDPPVADQVEPRGRPVDAVERPGAAARIVVAGHGDHRHAGRRGLAEHLRQPQLGRDAQQVAVEQVARQDQRVGLAVDGERDEAARGRCARTARRARGRSRSSDRDGASRWQSAA